MTERAETAEEKLAIARYALMAIAKNDRWAVPLAKHALERIGPAPRVLPGHPGSITIRHRRTL